MTKATSILHQKHNLDYGIIIEIKIWQLPVVSIERPHGYKYSLFCGRKGERLIGYDNERGKGDHRHLGKDEEPYNFISLNQLLEDFTSDVERVMRSLNNE